MTTAIEETPPTTTVGDQPARLSPLHAVHRALGAQFVEQAGWQIPYAYTSPENELAAVQERVGVADVSAAGKVIVKGHAAQEWLTDMFGVVPQAPGHVSPVDVSDGAGQPLGRGHIACLAADKFLLLTPPGSQFTIHNSQSCPEPGRRVTIPFVTLVDQTSGLAGLLVAGPASRDLLSKLCALPFAPVDFPNHRVAQSSLAKVHAVIVRNDLGNWPAFELYVERPYGEYVWDAVMDAGVEFGTIPFGWGAKALLDTVGD